MKTTIELPMEGADPNLLHMMTGIRHRITNGVEIPAIPIVVVGGITTTLLDGALRDFFTLDSDGDIIGIVIGDGTAQDLTILFNLDINKRLIWDESEDRFDFDDDLNIQGGLTASGAANISGALTAGAGTFTNLTSTGNTVRSVTVGITASTTQTQGQQALTTDINEVATVANANDVVTLPTATTGFEIYIRNNGANTLQIFPASGDAINGGAVDASVTLAVNTSVTFRAIDNTNWYS